MPRAQQTHGSVAATSDSIALDLQLRPSRQCNCTFPSECVQWVGLLLLCEKSSSRPPAPQGCSSDPFPTLTLLIHPTGSEPPLPPTHRALPLGFLNSDHPICLCMTDVAFHSCRLYRRLWSASKCVKGSSPKIFLARTTQDNLWRIY